MLQNSVYTKKHNRVDQLAIDERKAEIDNSDSQTYYFFIVHEFSVPVKQARINTYYFRLMLALLIPQIETSVAFVFNLRLHIVPDVTRIICE